MLTRHAISIRPICFSGKTLRKLPPDLQAAIRKAAAEAGDWERELESSSDTAILTALEKAGKLKQVKFEERDKLQAAMAPALAAYAKEIGADAIYAKINAIK
jgi:TRAP-type transport system periplasmic protein